ncbi:MAG: DUF1059 domain-containing protein [Candidatus Aenigmarchaeota archaeon]|nr:DUF1059 domain-containing protein [Candidatus Aenigmarchaeota archaeon]
MMKCIKCSDVMRNSCSFILRGETAEEVVDNIVKHGKIAHREEMKRMNHEKMRQLDIKVQNIMN